jgi:hypothetical protein
MMLKIGLALFIIAHGLVHAALGLAPDPADPDGRPGAFFTSPERSWLLTLWGLSAGAVRWTGLLLVALTTIGFVLAGLGIFGVPGLVAIWRTSAVVSAGISLLLLLLFWHRWLPVGVLINLGVLIALLWLKWPPAAMMGS